MPTGRSKTTPTQTQAGRGVQRNAAAAAADYRAALSPQAVPLLNSSSKFWFKMLRFFVTLLFIQDVFLFRRDQKET